MDLGEPTHRVWRDLFIGHLMSIRGQTATCWPVSILVHHLPKINNFGS